MKELPIACTLTPDQMGARASTLLPELVARVQEQQDIPGGIRLRFAAESETLRLIATVIDAERQCCRFLRFSWTWKPMPGRSGSRSPALLELESSSTHSCHRLPADADAASPA